MVDFNDGNTISTPAIDIVRVLILEKYTNVVEALEVMKKRGSTDNYDNALLQARLQSLYWHIAGALRRKKLEKEVKEIIFSNNAKFEDLLETFEQINNSLDDIKLIRIDTKQQIDTRRVANVNDRIS